MYMFLVRFTGAKNMQWHLVHCIRSLQWIFTYYSHADVWLSWFPILLNKNMHIFIWRIFVPQKKKQKINNKTIDSSVFHSLSFVLKTVCSSCYLYARRKNIYKINTITNFEINRNQLCSSATKWRITA